ncbi:radical SAM protein [uncultured Streptomyces sp.]|uniref:radical SAM protein n=1 Tax=uncultured Streptomyces sp. TaxID=174707 RepID=UPI00261D61E3|nr:radical SAM protein [uncultured Streptomyces sp.]
MSLHDLGPAPTDLTALKSFAALRGQLRVSLTPRCNIFCNFCHDEGDKPPVLVRADRTVRPRSRELDAYQYLHLINSLIAAGMKRVYFTGGEPLISPLARPVLTGLTSPTADTSYTLITNGTRVRRSAGWLRQAPLDKVKVSLHYFSDESLYDIANTRIGIGAVLDGIDAARDMFERVELNCLLLQRNAEEVPRILDYALERRLPVQFIELVDTNHNQAMAETALPAETVVSRLRTMTDDERVEVAGAGQGRRIFRIDGVEVDVIERNLGRYHVGQCGTCPLRAQCVEGFWALRLDHAGGVQPCLLREDLRLDVKDYVHDVGQLVHRVADHVAAFTEGTAQSQPQRLA